MLGWWTPDVKKKTNSTLDKVLKNVATLFNRSKTPTLRQANV